ncbi:MAG: EAL domain-containing protein [Hydrogenophaga sp.]|nr:EAL domain-containing protein [Hydrogenophaga sp.]
MHPTPRNATPAGAHAPPSRLKAAVFAGFTALALVVLPVAYWFNRTERADRDLSHQVEHTVEEVSSHLQLKLKAIELVLRGVRGFVEGSDVVTAGEFHAFVSSLQIDQTASGLLSVSFVPAVPDAGLERFLADLVPTLGVAAFQLRPAGQRDAYAPILFVEPALPQNTAILGLDVLTIPEAREAALRARDSVEVSLSTRFPLSAYEGSAGDGASAFAMYLPIFKGAPGQSPFLGWAGARFRFQDIVQQQEQLLHPGLHLQVFEGDQHSPQNLLFGMLDAAPAAFAPRAAPPYVAEGQLAFGGQRWTFTVTPTAHYLATHKDRLHHWLATLGVLLSLAAGLIVWLLMTARDRAQQAALAMTAELRALSSDLEGTLSAVPDLLFELDAQGRYLSLRTSTEQGLVMPREALIGKTVHEVLTTPAADACMSAIEEAGGTGLSVGQQIEIQIAGESRWFELSIARKPVDAGTAPRFVMLSRDITDRKNASQRLVESERALNEAQRVAAIGHFWVDLPAQRWRGSPSVCELLGLPPDQTLALSDVAAWVEPRFRDQFVEACTAPGSAHGTRLEFAVHRANDGSSRWMLMSGQPESADDPARATLFFTLQDVTERRRSEDQLRLLEKAVASLNDAVLITEAEPVSEPGPRIVFVNEAFERMTGYGRDEVLGQSPRILQGADTSRAERERIRQALDTWQPVRAELVNYTKAGQAFWVELVIQPMADERGWFTHWVAVERDITERRAAEQKVHELAFFDHLTRLPNRSQFMLLASERLGGQASGQLGAAILIDLDNFKVVNDHWGHHRGDQMLIEIARRVGAELAPHDTLARLGGDEFIVLLQDLGSDETLATQRAEAVCGRLLASVSRPMVIDGREYFSSASLGVVLLGQRPMSVEELLSQTDSAMYFAKDSGRNTYRFFDSRLQTRIAERIDLEADLRQSIERKELFLLYQPQVDQQGRVIGAEALCRWRNATRGLVSPAEFVPLAEGSGFIRELGPWVLETACKCLATWRTLPGMAALTLSVNVSARQFHHPDFVRQVQDALCRTGANPALLKLELTESIFAEDLDEIVTKMDALRAQGIRFSLDDFGTGYSSLSYLKKLPLDQLKIDQSFVRDVLSDSNDEAIIRTVIALGQSLGLNVIAEGVENEQQRASLLRSGCVLYQGYLFGRPMDEAALAGFVAASPA